MTAVPPAAAVDPTVPLDRPLVVGFGVTGRAVVRALVERGHRPTVVDDSTSADGREAAEEFGVTIHQGPTPDQLDRLVADASALLPSPGLPDRHPVFAAGAANDVPVFSEFDLAQQWDRRPLVAITGTNGKTTVTMMVTDMLNRSGLVAEAVGNTDVPLVAAIDHDETEVFVVEASSFRLGHSARFVPRVAAWLNFAPDHLDAHRDLAAYEQAKASIWSHLDAESVAVVNADDATVARHAERARSTGAEIRLFSLNPPNPAPTPGNDISVWYLDSEQQHLVGPDGPIMAVGELVRSRPHDVANALASAAIADAAGAELQAVVDTMRSFAGLPHRVELVGERNGIRWYNDSKATVPHATVAAMGGFDSVVLIAGGRNKGLSLDSLATTVPPVRLVIAIGDAGPEVARVFEPLVPVEFADSMAEAVDRAAKLANPGDAVVLSPSCTSFDWYRNYGERGNDFSTLVHKEVLDR